MPHEHDTLTESVMWCTCRHVQDAQRYHVLPDFRMVLCDDCVRRGPDSLSMDDLLTECVDCVQDQLGLIDWTRPTGYQVDRH